MRKILMLILMCSFTTSISYSQITTSPEKKDLDFLDEFRNDYISMFRNENFKLVQNKYSESIRLMSDFQETIIGKKNAEHYYGAFFNRFDIKKYERTKIEILNLGSRLIELGYFEMTVLDKDGKYELKGKYQQIWKLTSENNYELITEAWNYNHWVDFADKLRFKEVSSLIIALEPHVPVNDNISFELESLNCLMELVIMEKDAKLWSMFYSDDGMFIYSFNPIYEGRELLDEYFEKHAKEVPIFEKLDVRTNQIDELGGYIIEYASAIANWRNGESSGISTSKNIRIWRREPNGSLKIFRMIAMYD